MPKAVAWEHHEQVMLVQFLDAHPFWRTVPFFAVPNGGGRRPGDAARLKAEGVRAGVPDLVFPLACGAYHGLYLEMKTAPPQTYRVSPAQHDYHRRLAAQQYAVVVARGCAAAIDMLEHYRAGQLFERHGEAGLRLWWLGSAG